MHAVMHDCTCDQRFQANGADMIHGGAVPPPDDQSVSLECMTSENTVTTPVKGHP